VVAPVLRTATCWTTLALTGCFVGDAALGLPCERDEDCGLDLACVEGVCGGPQGTTTGTSSDTTDATTPTESTGPDTMCLVDPPQCLPMVPGTPDAQCNGDCTSPTCGDGYFNAEAPNDAVGDGSKEACDMGQQGQRIDTATCDEDCTLPVCGDGHFNAAASGVEVCDDGNDSDLDDCTAACRVPVHVERFDEEPDGWTVEPYGLSAYADVADPDWWPVDPKITDVTGWRWDDGAFDTVGVPYQSTVQNADYGYAGVTRLVSPEFVVPEPAEGFEMQLRFAHTLEVEPLACRLDADEHGDGGRVWVRTSEGDTLLQPEAPNGYVSLFDDCSDANPAYQRPNPMIADGGEAFSGRMQSDPAVAFALPVSGSVQFVFEFGTDCKYCPAVAQSREPSHWRIDDLVIAEFPQ
jgi:hypothetical protein